MGIFESKTIVLANKYGTANPFNICESIGIPIEYVDLDNPLGTRFTLVNPLLLFYLSVFKKNIRSI